MHTRARNESRSVFDMTVFDVWRGLVKDAGGSEYGKSLYEK